MSTRYMPLLAAVVTRLQAINAARVVTRTWEDFVNRDESELLAGVWMVLSSGIGRYPYEVSDGQFATDGLRATENGRLSVTVVGQLLLPDPNVSGEAIDAAEFDLIAELEQLADDAIETVDLVALKLNRVQMSQQVDRPLAWVFSEWEVFPLN